MQVFLAMKKSEKKSIYLYLRYASFVFKTIFRSTFKLCVFLRVIQGQDTSSAALSWFLYCIAKHPNEQVYINQNILIKIDFLNKLLTF